MARQRDYKAEYARVKARDAAKGTTPYAERIARGVKLGLTRSQARSHPKKNERKASEVIRELKKTSPELVKSASRRKQPGPKVPSRKKSASGGRNVIIKGRGKHGKDRQGVAWQGRGEKSLLKKVDELAQATPSRPLWLSVQNDDGEWCLLFTETAAQWVASWLQENQPLKDAIEFWIGATHGPDSKSPTANDISDDFGWEVMALA